MKKLTPKRAFEIIFISFFLITMIAYVAVAATPTMEELAATQKEASLEIQQDLNEIAVDLRDRKESYVKSINELQDSIDQIQAQVDSIDANITTLGEQWFVEQGKIEASDKVLAAFQQEQQSL